MTIYSGECQQEGLSYAKSSSSQGFSQNGVPPLRHENIHCQAAVRPLFSVIRPASRFNSWDGRGAMVSLDWGAICSQRGGTVSCQIQLKWHDKNVAAVKTAN